MKNKINVIIPALFIFLFSISSHSAQSFRFVVMSDSHNTLGRVNSSAVATAIRNLNPDIILHAGDFTCCGSGQGSAPTNRFKFDEYKFLGGIPIFPTTGNHDYDGNAQQEYNAFWSSRKPGIPISGEWAQTYSFNYKNFHFAALRWQNPDINWLKNDLKMNAGKPTIIFTHLAALNVGCKARYIRGLNEVVTTDRDVKAVFSGHSHCYGQYEIRPGAVQVFVGTVSHDNGRDPKYRRKHTFVVVDVEGQKLKICPASVEDGILEGGCKARVPGK